MIEAGQADKQALVPGVLAPVAIDAGMVGMTEQQKTQLLLQKAKERELQQMAQLVFAQKGTSGPQTENIRQRMGLRPTVSNREHMIQTGGMSNQMMQPSGQASPLVGDTDVVTEQGEETNLSKQLYNMTQQEREQFLKRISLDRRSIYDPLPDSTDAYQINLLLGRLNTERMYTL